MRVTFRFMQLPRILPQRIDSTFFRNRKEYGGKQNNCRRNNGSIDGDSDTCVHSV